MSATAFLGHQDPSAVVAWRGRQPLRVTDFMRDVGVVAAALPARRYLVNLCSDRYRFAVGLAAALLRDQVSLLPPAHTPELLSTLKQGYAGLYALSDGSASEDVMETIVYPETAATAAGGAQELVFPDAQLAAIAFTSGSTGEPAPHPKSWGRLALGAGEARLSTWLASAARCWSAPCCLPAHVRARINRPARRAQRPRAACRTPVLSRRHPYRAGRHSQRARIGDHTRALRALLAEERQLRACA